MGAGYVWKRLFGHSYVSFRPSNYPLTRSLPFRCPPIRNYTFRHNAAVNGEGGAIWLQSTPQLVTLTDVMLQNNSATSSGGGGCGCQVLTRLHRLVSVGKTGAHTCTHTHIYVHAYMHALPYTQSHTYTPMYVCTHTETRHFSTIGSRMTEGRSIWRTSRRRRR